MPRPFTLGRSKRRGKSRKKTSKKKVVNQKPETVNEQDKSTPLQVVSQLGEPPILHNDS